MLLQKAARPLLLRASCFPIHRSFSVAAARMGEGDTGATRPGGMQSECVLYLSFKKSNIILHHNDTTALQVYMKL
jgi:hypothetical protein